jgi:hypothetical protein
MSASQSTSNVEPVTSKEEPDPLIEFLDNAPPEDEHISPEEEAAVEEARREIRAGGKMYSAEEIEREFG